MTDIVTILCGGASSRMGQDKALLTIDGEPLLLRHIRLAEAAGFRVQVAAGTRSYDFLPASVICTQDILAEQAGPLSALGGALQALAVCGESATFMMPVDTLIEAQALRELITPALPAPWVTIAQRGQLHNTFAYVHISVLPRIEQWLASGIRALQPLNALQGAKLRAMPEEWAACLGFNTPEEWQQVQENL